MHLLKKKNAFNVFYVFFEKHQYAWQVVSSFFVHPLHWIRCMQLTLPTHVMLFEYSFFQQKYRKLKNEHVHYLLSLENNTWPFIVFTSLSHLFNPWYNVFFLFCLPHTLYCSSCSRFKFPHLVCTCKIKHVHLHNICVQRVL